jgi:hypothetical protein
MSFGFSYDFSASIVVLVGWGKVLSQTHCHKQMLEGLNVSLARAEVSRK